MATGMLTLGDLKREITAGTIDTVVAAMVDLQGRLVGKRFHAHYFAEVGHEETHGCNYLLGVDIEMEPVPGYRATSWELGYGDFVLKPDLSTLRRIPWLPGTALVICDVLDHHTHEDVPHSPRAILKHQLRRLGAMKLKACVASELEFFLFDDSYDGAHRKGYRNLRTSGYYIEDYHILQTTKDESVMRAIRNGLNTAGIPVENSKGEWGPGQEEINVRYAEALEMADRHAIIKNGCKEIAYGLGRAITFMAKWDYGMAGSSCHVHQSLWSADGSSPKRSSRRSPSSKRPTSRPAAIPRSAKRWPTCCATTSAVRRRCSRRSGCPRRSAARGSSSSGKTSPTPARTRSTTPWDRRCSRSGWGSGA